MGYTTNFDGQFKFSRQLTVDELVDLDGIHEKDWRDDDTRPGGKEGYGYYCQWVSDKRGMNLEWDEGEKFYYYVEWLKWLIKNFFEPKGIKLNGSVDWEGEENRDIGRINIRDNVVKIQKAKVIMVDE